MASRIASPTTSDAYNHRKNVKTSYNPRSFTVVVAAADIMLTAGDKFVIDVSGGPGCCNLSGGATYAGGDLFLNEGGNLTDYSQFRYGLTFETFVDASVSNAVPEPSSLSMLFADLGIMAGAFGLKRMKVATSERNLSFR